MADRSPHTILLLDDDAGILRLGRKALERAGHAVMTAETTAAADAVLCADSVTGGPPVQGQRIALIVLDYQLAGPSTGLDYFRSLAARGCAPPAVLLTGFADEKRVLEALRVGVRDVVRKSDDFFETLPRTVERVLREVEAERAVEAEAIRESEHRLRIALAAGRLGSWEIDLVTAAVEASPTCRSHFGLPPEPLAGEPPLSMDRVVAHIHPEDRTRAEAEFRRISDAMGEGDIEFRTLGPAGQVCWVAARGRVIHGGPRRSPRMIGVTLDFTARKAAEQELRAAKDAAEAASSAKDHFLAVLSHELRTPLTPVLATVHELATDPSLSPRAREAVEMIRRNVELETKLVDDLLDLTRISKGKLSLTVRPTDLHDAVRAVVRMCEGEVTSKGIRLSVDLAARRHWVPADPARLQQVLWNLLKNAAKFTPDGGAVAVRTEDVGGAGVRVEVRDSGIGIPPDLLPKIFDAFEQGEGAVNRQFGGLGLGLAITRALVHLHGGAIAVRSDGKGRGATFTVDLAALPGPPAAALPTGVPAAGTDQPERSHAAAPPADSASPAPRLSILLVEDHPDTASALARLLKLFGHDVQVADSVASAIQAIESHPFDVLVSDIGLPDGSGLDLMRHVRRRLAIRGVVLSGFGMEEDVRRSLEAGFLEHLTKPVTPDDLNDAILRVARGTAAAMTAGTDGR